MEAPQFSAKAFAEAHQRIGPFIMKTPLLTCRSIEEKTPHSHVFFKCENLQKTGSFKIRGATNAVLSSLIGSDSDITVNNKNNNKPPARYFVTHSSGNHGQAVALAAQSAGGEAHIIVPKTAPKSKIIGIKEFGATLHMCEPTLKAREETCAAVEVSLLNKNPNANITFIHPFDDPRVICGQGTIGLEILEQVKAVCETKLEAIIVPVGGGGMLSGISQAVKNLNPSIKVFGAEPATANDVSRGLKAGKRQTLHVGNVATPNTIADGLMTFTSERTFGIIQKYVDGIIEVSEQEIREAFQLVYERMKIVIEPSAAVGVAALLKKDPRLASIKGPVAVVICGGNVDFDKISSIPLAKL